MSKNAPVVAPMDNSIGAIVTATPKNPFTLTTGFSFNVYESKDKKGNIIFKCYFQFMRVQWLFLIAPCRGEDGKFTDKVLNVTIYATESFKGDWQATRGDISKSLPDVNFRLNRVDTYSWNGVNNILNVPVMVKLQKKEESWIVNIYPIGCKEPACFITQDYLKSVKIIELPFKKNTIYFSLLGEVFGLFAFNYQGLSSQLKFEVHSKRTERTPNVWNAVNYVNWMLKRQSGGVYSSCVSILGVFFDISLHDEVLTINLRGDQDAEKGTFTPVWE